jgi:succinate dehydrogenase hydrophobic anchor subunit
VHGPPLEHTAIADHDLIQAKQSIDVRSEANNWAIYIFTAVTVIFLPLTFVTGLLSMNTSGLRDSTKRQWIYWAIAIPFTIMVIVIALFVGKFRFRDHWNRARPTLADSVEWFGRKFERITNSDVWWFLRYGGYLLSIPFRPRAWKTLLRRCLHPRRYYRYHY